MKIKEKLMGKFWPEAIEALEAKASYFHHTAELAEKTAAIIKEKCELELSRSDLKKKEAHNDSCLKDITDRERRCSEKEKEIEEQRKLVGVDKSAVEKLSREAKDDRVREDAARDDARRFRMEGESALAEVVRIRDENNGARIALDERESALRHRENALRDQEITIAPREKQAKADADAAALANAEAARDLAAAQQVRAGAETAASMAKASALQEAADKGKAVVERAVAESARVAAESKLREAFEFKQKGEAEFAKAEVIQARFLHRLTPAAFRDADFTALINEIDEDSVTNPEAELLLGRLHLWAALDPLARLERPLTLGPLHDVIRDLGPALAGWILARKKVSSDVVTMLSRVAESANRLAERRYHIRVPRLGDRYDADWMTSSTKPESIAAVNGWALNDQNSTTRAKASVS